MLTPSGALLLPALQQNAAAAVAAFAAAAAAAAQAHQQGTAAAYNMANTPVLMAPFQRTRLKVLLNWTGNGTRRTDVFVSRVQLPTSGGSCCSSSTSKECNGHCWCWPLFIYWVALRLGGNASRHPDANKCRKKGRRKNGFLFLDSTIRFLNFVNQKVIFFFLLVAGWPVESVRRWNSGGEKKRRTSRDTLPTADEPNRSAQQFCTPFSCDDYHWSNSQRERDRVDEILWRNWTERHCEKRKRITTRASCWFDLCRLVDCEESGDDLHGRWFCQSCWQSECQMPIPKVNPKLNPTLFWGGL